MAADIRYGTGIPTEAELRLCGEIGEGRRVLELGVSDWYNSIAFATSGAKAIAVDPDAARIAEMRSRAELAEVSVQCHTADLADLGDVASGACDAVVAAGTIDDVDDLGRLLRQVHRVLKPSMPFVMSMPHPFSLASEQRPYGSGPRTIGEWFTALGRANFRVDQLRELGSAGVAPAALVVRARKEGS